MTWQIPVSVIFFSFLPSLLFFFYILIKYRSEDLDRIFFIKLMVWGSASVVPGVFIVSMTTSLVGNDFIGSYLIKPFIAVALVEESLKLIIFAMVVYRNRRFKTIKQGIIYGIAIGLGFAFAENILYLTGSSAAFPVIMARSLTSVPLHTLCGAFMGFYAGIGKTGEKQYLSKALLISLAIHGIYNILVNLHFPYYLLSIIFIILALLFLKQQYSKLKDISSF